MHFNNLGHKYYIFIIASYIFLLNSMWIIGVPLIAFSYYLYFFGKDMRVFKELIPSFNIFFFGINIVLSSGVIYLNFWREYDEWIATALGLSVISTSGFYYRMVKVAKSTDMK